MHGKNAETIKTSDPAHFTSGFLDRHSSASCAAGSCDDEISVRRRKDLGGCDRHLSGIRLFGRKDRRQKDGEQKIPVGAARRNVLFCSAFLLTLILKRNIDPSSIQTITTACLCMGGGMLGGMLAF